MAASKKSMDVFAPDARPKAITLRLVMEHSLTKSEFADYNTVSVDEAMERARGLKTLHIEWQNIGELANLECFESAEVLYAQYNRIPRIEGLEALPHLQFLALQSNRISVVENLLCLQELEFLDLSKNQIATLNVDELPLMVNMLSLKDNACTETAGYREQVMKRLPELVTFDGESLEKANTADGQLPEEPIPAPEVQLESHEKGLSAYFRKDELQSGLEANVAERIQAYSIEALADVDEISTRADEAAERSRARRDKLERSATASSSFRSGQLAALLKEAAADME